MKIKNIQRFSRLISSYGLMSMLLLGGMACSDKDNKGDSARILLDDDAATSYALSADGESCTINFTATTSWEATLEESTQSASKASATSWLKLNKEKGIGGKVALTVTASLNESDVARSALLKLACGSSAVSITFEQAGNTVRVMSQSDVKDFDKYYKPAEFGRMDMLRSDSKWSWFRSAQSENFFVFWEPDFGTDPNSESVPSHLRVDIDDLLLKAEQFYKTNVEVLKFAEKGSGKSYLDQYKMEIYLIYQDEWLATGSGYDNVIGALWVNPSTCQPVGSTIAHEIGHSFQYQVYCDKLLMGAADDYKQGFRYGYQGSNGGNGFWEQCAQWQSFQDYPEQLFPNYHFNVWMANYHRHFSHEWMRYASYWMQYYWAQKHGIDVVAKVWIESASPEDPIQTYMRLYCGNQLEVMHAELYDYAARMATFDIDFLHQYASDAYQGKYATQLFKVADNYHQVAYASCPGTTGFNVIALNVPAAGTEVTVDFAGLAPGSELAANDPGQYMESEVVKGNVTTYNNVNPQNAGWRYGFVAHKANGTREYSAMQQDAAGKSSFTVPANTQSLYFVVMGAPTKYVAHPWDEKELNDEQWPYKVKFEGTGLLGDISIDETAKPQDISFTYNVSFPAAESYDGTSVNLKSNGDLQKLAQAFVQQPAALSGLMLSAGSQPAEGKIAFAAIQADGSIEFNATANGFGHWFDSKGDVTSWGSDNDSKLFVEYSASDYQFTIGQYPGKSKAGDKYTVKETMIYTVSGTKYQATFIFNITLN